MLVKEFVVGFIFVPNPIQTGLFEGFLTIMRQLKDLVVKGGSLRTTSGF